MKAKPHVHTEGSARLVWVRPSDALGGRWGPGLLDHRAAALALFLAMTALYVVFG